MFCWLYNLSTEDKPVEGKHPYALPLIDCPECGETRGKPDVAYPEFDVARLKDAGLKRFLIPRNGHKITWPEYVRLREALSEVFGPSGFFPSGAKFGRFQGKVYDRPIMTDLVMTVSGCLLARRPVAGRLNELGAGLRFEEVDMKPSKGYDLIQICPPVIDASAHPICLCPACDRAPVPRKTKSTPPRYRPA